MKSTLKLSLLTVFITVINTCVAQKTNESFYAFKEDWSPAPSIDACTYFMQQIKKSDTEYICRFYRKFGPMVKQESYKDADLSIPNGFFCWYNDEGLIDSSGMVVNLKKDGRWNYLMNDSINKFYEEYENGKFIKRDVYRPVDTTNTEKDPTEKEALFKKDSTAWTKYISSSIKIPDRFSNTQKPGKYVITVSFTINKTGDVEQVVLLKSVEWSADAEVFRIIEHSPRWQPAIQKGQPVLYRQKQNIVFRVTEN